MLYYRPHETWTARSDFRIRLPPGEDITCELWFHASFPSMSSPRTNMSFPPQTRQPPSSPILTPLSNRSNHHLHHRLHVHFLRPHLYPFRPPLQHPPRQTPVSSNLCRLPRLSPHNLQRAPLTHHLRPHAALQHHQPTHILRLPKRWHRRSPDSLPLLILTLTLILFILLRPPPKIRLLLLHWRPLHLRLLRHTSNPLALAHTWSSPMDPPSRHHASRAPPLRP